jgi:[ribosomal protein S5]-alanine N-acetyltransferase
VGTDYSYAIRLRHQRLIGSCGVINDFGKIQFGYIISPTHWGHGYATEVCVRLMEILRSKSWVKSVGTFVDAENHASERVLIKSGLVVAEKREKWFSFVNQDNALKDCLMFKLPLENQR